MFEEDKIENEFRDKLKSFEVPPPNDLWTEIENDLNTQGRKKVYLIISYASAAVITLLFAIGGILYLNSQKELPNQSNFADTKPTHQTLPDLTKTENLTKREIVVSVKPENTDNNQFTKVGIVTDTIISERTFIAENPVKTLQLRGANLIRNKDIKAEKLVLKNSNKSTNGYLIVQDQPAKTKSNCTVNVSGFPVYAFHTNGLTNSKSHQNESGLISWGANVSFKRSFKKNLEIESGISYSPFGQQIKNIYFVSYSPYDSQVTANQGLETSLGNLPIPLASNSRLMYISQVNVFETDVSNAGTFKRVNVTQILGYVEIPVLLVKKVNLNKYNIQFKGGLVSGFLVNNKMEVYGRDFTMSGKTDGVNVFDMSLVGSFGLSYPIYNNVKLTLDPTFKYSLRSINSSLGKTHPFSTFIKIGFEILL